MHIGLIKIKNITSIDKLEISFQHDEIPLAGWHVLIGDNGSGKTSILRAISVCLCGPGRFKSFRYNERRLLKKGADTGTIFLELIPSEAEIKDTSLSGNRQLLEIEFRKAADTEEISFSGTKGTGSKIWNGTYAWFSASFGPFRRLTGGNSQSNKLFEEDHRVAAHISAFEPEVAFVQVDEWLTRLQLQKLEKKNTFSFIDLLIEFINQDGLLPNGFKLTKITSKGVFFSSPADDLVPLDWLSDGYRSVLSLMLELIRQMTVFFPEGQYGDFFAPLPGGRWAVRYPGVVLIDEVDAHLHPTWQVRIGQWLTRYFPHIQFIVTTHSPLICRAAEHGSVWKLAVPGSEEESGQVTGTDLQRLIYGNVLDAYGTEVFGENVTRSDRAHGMLDELARLNKRSVMGTITPKERSRLEELRSILPTESL